jgi:hypothetical protein
MQNGDHYIVGLGGYDGKNANAEGVKTLQKVIEDISTSGGASYSAGNNISIENDTISALGYTYNKEKDSFSIGSATATG